MLSQLRLTKLGSDSSEQSSPVIPKDGKGVLELRSLVDSLSAYCSMHSGPLIGRGTNGLLGLSR